MSDQTPPQDQDQPGEAPQEATEPVGAAEEEAPRNGVINVLGQDWAIGIAWYFYDRAVYQAALDRLLVGFEAIYVARAIEPGNFGIADPAMGHAAKIPSAAAALSNWRAGSWISAYPLGSGLYWIIGVVRNAIVEDTPALGESEARARFKELTTREWSWETIYAPEGWELGGLSIAEDNLLRPALEADLRSSGLADRIQGARIVERYVRKYGPWAASVVVLIALFFLLDVTGRVQRFLEKEVLVAPPTVVDLPAEWTTQPLPAPWLLACARSLQPLAYFVPGWELDQITCDAESDRVVYEYRREPGGVTRQLEVIWDDITDQKQLQTSTSLSFVVTPLGYAENGPVGVEPTHGGGALSTIYFDLALIIDDVPDIGALVEVPQRRINKAAENVIEVTPRTSYVPVSMQSEEYSPKRWYETFGLAGMTVDRVVYDGQTWSYEGKIYAK